MKPYFKKTGESLFCNDYLMSEALRHTPHIFFKEIKKLVDWDRYSGPCLKLYKAKGTLGAPAYRPSLLLKVLFLCYLYAVPEREIERYINDSIGMKHFLGLALEEPAPDHSSLTVFRDRIIKKGKGKALEEIFNDIMRIAKENGVVFGSIQVIDSTHTTADVNMAKDKAMMAKGKEGRDPDAKIGVKGMKKVRVEENGIKKMIETPKYIYGYKNHLSVNAETNLVTGYLVSSAERYDGHFFHDLVKKDLALGVAVPEKTLYTADRGYDDGENHAWLSSYKLKNGIIYKKIDWKNPMAKWDEITTTEEFCAGKKKRYVVERVNGCLKKHHRLDRCRYLGLAKMEFQTFFSCLAHNLKTLVRLTAGVGFRTPIPVRT